MGKFSRRDLLRSSALGLGSLLAGARAVESAGLEPGIPLSSEAASLTRFLHGVASGDPQHDRLIIWTRVTLDPSIEQQVGPAGIQVAWNVAEDAQFRRTIRSGYLTTSSDRDFTVKVDLVGLLPGRRYYYRFNTFDAQSPVGVGRTLPDHGVEQVRFAVVSCASYPAGYFNVYHDIARLGSLDAVLHLGDYIYEYGAASVPRGLGDGIGRGHAAGNDQECVALADYRRRYAHYRTDPDLQSLHLRVPFICVWDDHEIANDAWRDGAENHNAGEGSYTSRKQAALQAWFEWMPVRQASSNDLQTIHRRFDFGDLVSLHMLDARLAGRDRPLDYRDYLPENGDEISLQFDNDLYDFNRTMLGASQFDWLRSGLQSSGATWQLIGQQLPMARMQLPVELVRALIYRSPADVLTTLGQLASIKRRLLAGDASVSAIERARVENILPYNLQAWDGYWIERERLLSVAAQANSNLLVLSGDTHNAWANDLSTAGGKRLGAEFSVPSATSPGLESFLDYSADLAPAIESALQLLIGGTEFCNVHDRGYLVLSIARNAALAEYIFVSNVLNRGYERIYSRSKVLAVRAGAAGRRIEPL